MLQTSKSINTAQFYLVLEELEELEPDPELVGRFDSGTPG
jgi:hypothetical protein